ncbi:AAA family ATPase [Lactococcus lactis]|jgi:energy-coupling factor transporter ATP-binding protein EcfA2|uniref:AAA family ATPase n=1 Tax=Lactococcus TaxID=1357 RepID=UPI00071D8DD4|nr:AAA family ATPase [Lactococcus lactis]KST88413.1 Translation-disabling ACNase RloC [Lactococcus lactis subsp. lactis]MDT2869604.1 AAA family ATPase [Lactococcus lactis]MDT2873200.1 AAA family ATPase [Lactococcus lactis]MDT2874868.1 AAA family ATPase [Lactococcus lactis]MDT2879472.1 AAA family ATPase [Lactococcus lactis]
MINTINLSNYSFVFSKSELSDLKRKNFIYGKNGTGKSSLVKAIREQYSDTYDIRVFDGWRGIIKENNYLDAIALGEINVDKQIEIDEIDEKIKEIDKEISEPQAGIENLFKKQNKIKSSYDLQNRKIETFYTSSASKISTKLSLGRSYDKRNFKIDIPLANILSERDINRLRETIKADKIIINPKISFPKIDLDKYLVATNGILQTVVLPSGIINELTNNIEKQNFAKLGMKIHNRDIDNEPCSFCGSVISKDRWVQLDRYFSDEVEKLDRRVADGLNNIENCLKSINDISIIDEKQYYPEYKELIQELNFEILEIKSSYNKSLNILKNALEEKKGKTIIKVDQVNVEISQTLSDFQLKYDDLYEKNMMYAENLEQKQKIANEMIRYHEVKISLDNFDYTGEKAILVKLESNNQLLSNDISSLKGEKNSLLQEKRKLIADMTKELSTVSRINEFLRGLGSRSFSLDYIDTPDGQKGQYRLLDTNGAERSVQTLSDGEKNILSFLWFMDSIEEIPDESERAKEKIVIFDDPMNSNDDSCQYLMMGVIQKFYRQENHPQLFLLTHNNHFYLQVTPHSKKYPSKSRNPEQRYIKFLKTENRTSMLTISCDSENIKTIYDELWEELKYAYEQNKVTFMWNNMRRILETYNRFNFKNNSPSEIENEFEDSVDKVLIIALIKSLNVNSHVGYETDIDISGKTRDELKDIFSYIFEKLNASQHFTCYWAD